MIGRFFGCLGIGLAVVLLLAGMTVGAIWYSTLPLDFRYRMTVEVMTPTGLRVGAAVREMQVTNRGWMKANWCRILHGEAVAVDLPNGQTLFALVRSAYDDDWMVPTLLDRNFNTHRDEPMVASVGRAIENRRMVDVPRFITGPNIISTHDGDQKPTELWPNLVTFKNIGDPTSIEHVDPSNIGASFGPGYSINRITIQVVDDPVTNNIAQRLPWLSRVDEMFNGAGIKKNVTGAANYLEAFSVDLNREHAEEQYRVNKRITDQCVERENRRPAGMPARCYL